MLANARELLSADEIAKLGLPPWTHAQLDKCREFAHAFDVPAPAAVHVVGLGGHRDDAVNVYCSESEVARLRKICRLSLQATLVGLSWVHEFAIPQVALHRLAHDLPGNIEYDEWVSVNKVKHPDGRET